MKLDVGWSSGWPSAMAAIRLFVRMFSSNNTNHLIIFLSRQHVSAIPVLMPIATSESVACYVAMGN